MSSKASIIVSRFKSWDSSYCTRCYVRIRRPHSGNRTKPSKNHHSCRFQIKISISYNQGALHRGKPVFLNAKIHEGILFQFQHLAFTYISLFVFRYLLSVFCFRFFAFGIYIPLFGHISCQFQCNIKMARIVLCTFRFSFFSSCIPFRSIQQITACKKSIQIQPSEITHCL